MGSTPITPPSRSRAVPNKQITSTETGMSLRETTCNLQTLSEIIMTVQYIFQGYLFIF